MERQAEIVNNSLTRIEDLSDNALARIEYLQADSMARILVLRTMLTVQRLLGGVVQ